ncbi:MAG: carboxylating nicotinate-nucleotide diphosphorylase [SAR202 cluster bacterium]|nr:carboxylating nicotinate-nucleotide diphosphorylase [SAR202 cluster bacterium]|tara:strand:- start:556 stop:1410 length:855 start_codon:yes stop_codon:yes gene_type:complete
MSTILSLGEINRFIDFLITEDAAERDITTESVVDEDIECNAVIEAKEQGVACGIDFAEMVFRQLDPTINITKTVQDGAVISKGEIILELQGKASVILSGERIALNLLQHLSGISTLTAQYVDSVKSTKAVITDTRKTVPGIRRFQKYAVTMGGGKNHRMDLEDGILIKDNHIKFNEINGLSISDVVRKSRDNSEAPTDIEIEVDNLDQFRAVLQQEPDIILLDNMDTKTMKMAVNINNNKALLEASGGVTLSTVKEIAETGVDLISVGALTHSSRALDMSLNIL